MKHAHLKNKNLFAVEDYVKKGQIESLLVKNAPLGILMTDKNGVIVYENPYFAEKIIGVSRGQASKALGMKIQEMPNVIAAGISGNIKKVLRGKSIKNLIFPFVSIYGKKSFMSVDGVSLKNSNGKITGSLLMIKDITQMRSAELELLHTKEELLTTLKSIGDAVIVTDINGKITFLNRIARNLTRWSENEAIGQPMCHVFNIFNEKTGKKVVNPVLRVIKSGNIVGLGNHTILIDRDGKKIAIEDSAAPIKDVRGKIIGVVLVFHDVTENREIGKKIEKTSKALRIISKCNEALIRINDEQKLLNEICKVIVGVGGYRFVWIGYAEKDKNKSVKPMAWSGFSKQYVSLANITWANIERGRGPVGTVIRTRKFFVCKNTIDDPRFRPWRLAAIKYGYRSLIALPIFVDGIIGTINIYSSELDAFSEDEIKLLLQLAGDLSYGIKNIRRSKALKESEEKYRDLISNLPSTEYVLVYEKGKLLWLSQTAEKFLGYPRKKLIGSSILNYIDLKYKPIVLENMKRRLIRKKTKDYEIVVVNKYGKRLTVLVRGSNINYEGKDASLIILSDITEIAKKDEELKLKNIDLMKFKLAVDSASDNIIITDPNGVILYANSAVEKTNGYAMSEIIGKTPALWGGQMTKEFYKDFWKTIKIDKKPYAGEIRNKRKDGDFYTAEVKVAPILDDKNEIKFFVSTYRDITIAKELDRAKSEFVSVASHQLKTPVTGIKWITESLLENKENNLSKEQLVKMKEVYESNERMINLINDLLNISRIDPGKSSLLKLEKAEIAPIIDRAIKNLSSFADQRGVKIIYNNYLPDKYALTIDEDKIYQTVINLISNSIKYSRASGGEAEITVKLEDGEFMFSIRDNGIGIPLQNQRHIFEKFYRADNASTSQTSGSGLGLYIAKYFVESHKGKIWFESQEGVGTTFNFFLKEKNDIMVNNKK